MKSGVWLLNLTTVTETYSHMDAMDVKQCIYLMQPLSHWPSLCCQIQFTFSFPSISVTYLPVFSSKVTFSKTCTSFSQIVLLLSKTFLPMEAMLLNTAPTISGCTAVSVRKNTFQGFGRNTVCTKWTQRDRRLLSHISVQILWEQ